MDFFMILVDLGGQVGKENRAKTGQDRARQGKTRQDKDQGKTRQDFGRQRAAVESGRGGVGGVRPAIRGIPLLGGYCIESPPLT